jgi:hypothetical protein
MPNLFPIASGNSPQAQTTAGSGGMSGGKVKFGRSWRFDYEKGDFVLTPTGKIPTCTGVDAWLEWCKKTLRTERYTYVAYSRNHGQQFEELIPRHLSRRANESEIVRMTREALKTDPRTNQVAAFSFAWEGERCTFQCEVTNVRGQTFTIDGSVVTT